MIKTEKMLKLVSENGIRLSSEDLGNEVQGYYENGGINSFILINSRFENENKKYRCILAQCLGYAFIGDCSDITQKKSKLVEK
jgi:hypothetical protein